MAVQDSRHALDDGQAKAKAGGDATAHRLELPEQIIDGQGAAPLKSRAQKGPTKREGAAKKEPSRSLASSTIRVDVDLLDSLMNLVGELVVARNQILQVSQVGDPRGLGAATQRLNLITSELQEGVM